MHDERVGFLDHVGFVFVEDYSDVLILVVQGGVGFPRDEIPAFVEDVVITQDGFVDPPRTSPSYMKNMAFISIPSSRSRFGPPTNAAML